MDRRALRVAVSIGPDFRPRVVALHKRIVVRHRAVRRDPHHLAEMTGEILRRLQRVAFAERHEQISVRRKGKPRAEVKPAAAPGLHAKNNGYIFQLPLAAIAGKPRMRHRRPVHHAARFGNVK
jgi:hypothetical protein